jgi:hypothetical protein
VSEDEIRPERFASVFAEFIQQVAAAAGPEKSPLLDRITEHLGADPAQLPVTSEQFDTFEAPNLQLAIDAYLAADGRSGELVGISMDNKRFMAAGLSDLVVRRSRFHPPLHEGPVDYTNYHLANDEVLPCVQFGLYLVRSGDSRMVVFVSGPSELGDPRRQRMHVEVMATRTADAPAFIAEISRLMQELNVYRGHTILLSTGMQIGPGPNLLIKFQSIPRIAKDDVILPGGVLERIERHTVRFSEHVDELRRLGRSLKRGVLLFGLPGTGKTLTLMYLVGRMPGRTVILVTGRGLGLIETVAKMARQLAPAMIVLEDVDLVAEERTMPGRSGSVLFELLNEMDGLRDDQDVIFVLTTNRPDILEPALAARPGRVDLAVELPLPDGDGRRRLVELYSRGLDVSAVDAPALVERTEGASPAYIKELLRKAALYAVERGRGAVVGQEDVDAALGELAQGGRLAERILGFRPDGGTGVARVDSAPPTGEPRPTGFPVQIFSRRPDQP